MKFYRILFIISLLVVSKEARPDDSIIGKISSPGYFCLYTKLAQNSSDIAISNVISNNQLLFESNAKAAFSLGFHYSWLGLEYSFSLPSGNVGQFGRTRSHSFYARYKKHKLIVDFSLKNYIGYYLSNPEKFDSNWDDENKYPQVPGLKTKSMVASVYYVLKPDNYYANAVYSYKRKIHISGGSWLLRGFATRNTIFSDSSIVPLSIRKYVDAGINSKNIIATDFGASIGYSYLWALPKNNFVALTLLPGLSFQHVIEQSSIDESVKKYNLLSPQAIINFSIGHNTEKYYWALSANYESKNTGSDVSLELEKVGITFVYRMDTANWKFMKGVDKVMHPRFLKFVMANPPKRE
jgi:hypothetical protein